MLDTHIVIWLYTNNIDKISIKAQEHIEKDILLISSIVLLELQYLFEVGKILISSNNIFEDLNFRIGLKIEEDISFNKIINESLKINWTRDLFDRLIVSHTNILSCNLISKDRLIQSNCNHVIW
jgi:PIN domain nuclease of toxin-antitoxin system